MDLTGDELAGIVDLFGGLTRVELRWALAELAFKAGEDRDPDTFDPVIDDALHSYHLVAVTDAGSGGGEVADGSGDGAEDVGSADDGGNADDDLLVPGPVAFPTLPDGATDLPHILDVEERPVDQEAAGRAAESRFRAEAASAVEAGDEDRIATLLDVSYELEAWAPVDLEAARARLDEASGG